MAMSKGIPPLADCRPEIDNDGGGQVQPQVLQYALRLGLELGSMRMFVMGYGAIISLLCVRRNHIAYHSASAMPGGRP